MIIMWNNPDERKLTYDPLRDLSRVSQVSKTDFVFGKTLTNPILRRAILTASLTEAVSKSANLVLQAFE